MGEYAMDDILGDNKKRIRVSYYILIMLSFAIPLLIVGYFVTRNGNGMMFALLMFVLVFWMRKIDDYICRQSSMTKKGEC
jgi:uncharacterized membrane protein